MSVENGYVGLGQVRVNQHVEATTTNATTHLTVRVQFPQVLIHCYRLYGSTCG